jgi:hypothetical protein
VLLLSICLAKFIIARTKLTRRLAQYQKALKLDKNFTEARFDLGVALFDQGQLCPQAAKEFEVPCKLVLIASINTI